MIRGCLIKILIGVGIIIVVLFVVYFSFFSIHSVKSFGPLKLGDQTPLKSGDGTSAPYRYILESRFYVYAVEKDMGWCALEGCGMSGVLVNCMEGWLSADATMAADEYGLKEEDVKSGKASMIIVADENSKIVGIYPNYIVQNVPYILKNHRNLLDRFDFCYNVEMPKKFKNRLF